jgi:hypothetical protein
MPRFLACCRWNSYSHSYGEYDTLEEAVARLNEVARNSFARRYEVVSYYVNELALPGIYPVVAKTYHLL